MHRAMVQILGEWEGLLTLIKDKRRIIPVEIGMEISKHLGGGKKRSRNVTKKKRSRKVTKKKRSRKLSY